eukprot:1486155-Rhodomonas_salina.1
MPAEIKSDAGHLPTCCTGNEVISAAVLTPRYATTRFGRRFRCTTSSLGAGVVLSHSTLRHPA